MIGAGTATALAVAVAALSLGLHALYRQAPFVAFALAGSYATPALVPSGGGLVDLALYLGVWDVVYAVYAVWLGRRSVYLAALYAGLVVYRGAWRWDGLGPDEWIVGVLFLAAHVAWFGLAVAWFSVRRRPLAGWGDGLLHAGALALFHFLTYPIVEARAPDVAPWAAAAFAIGLYVAWAAARAAGAIDRPEPRAGRIDLAGDLGTGLAVVHFFAGLVLVHAVWWDGVPRPERPLAALAIAAALLVLPRLVPAVRRGSPPLQVAAWTLVAFGWIHLLQDWERDTGSTAASLLAAMWPALLYVLYFFRPRSGDPVTRTLLLTFAHALALAGWAMVVERWWGDPEGTIEQLWLSLGWAGIGLGLLAVALVREDRLLARSTLGIFGAFAAKVALFDLGDADPLVRVGILVVLGGALYAGGWIYRRVMPPDDDAPSGAPPAAGG